MTTKAKDHTQAATPDIPATMRAIIKAERGPGLTLVNDYPVPDVGYNDVLVKMRAGTICGSDLHIYNWDEWAQGRINPPLVVGHELCGDVVRVGKGVRRVKVGDFVSFESHLVCGYCYFCRTGQGHICENTKIIGVDHNGGFADYVVMPAENAWINPPDTPERAAVLLENFGNAVHTAFAQDLSSRTVLVTGCGPVGIMAVACARAAGARNIFATDISDYRLNMAHDLGADVIINPLRDDVVKIVLDHTGGLGADVLLEMSGAPSAIEQGFTALRDGGEAALLGLTPGPFTFDLNDLIVFKAATVRGIAGRRLWDSWYRAQGLLESGQVDLTSIITHKFDMSEFEDAYETFASGQSGKVLICF